jgi:hypothetical protein
MTTKAKNPFTWIEIYVENMDRAIGFYEAVLQVKMTPMQAPGDFGDLVMYCFPWAEGDNNISGALCQTKEFKAGTGGTLVYFACDDCSVELSRVASAGGTVIQEKFAIGEHGHVALAMDTEGNTIGFHSSK